MKNAIIGLLAGLLLGAGGGFAAGIFLFPYLFPPPPVNEAVSDAATRVQVATGTFVHANPADPVHYGKGGLTLYEDLLHLEADFEVGPGPKFHVYLVPDADVTPDTAVDRTMYVDLGRLKAFTGSQNYPVPDGVDLKRFGSVVVWCEKFGVLISPAKLAFGG